MSTVSDRSSFIKLFGDRGQFDLGVAGGGRGKADDRAEISLPVDEGIPQAEILGQPHKRLVNRRVAVRVITSRRVAANLCAFSSFRVRRQPQLLIHHVQDASLDGFKPVPHVGQGPGGDDRERVIEVSAASFLAERDEFDAVDSIGAAVGAALESFALRSRRR